MGIVAISLLALAILISPGTPLWALMSAVVLNGFGNGIAWTSVSAITSASLPPDVAGAGSGVFNAMRSLGAAIGAAGVGGVMQARLAAAPDGPAGHAAAMGQSLVFFVVMLALALVATSAMRADRDRRGS
ncbi:MFS transporter [Amycolatopsis sp. NPDC089917]|uniref:MFS transporter n=1 Tax=Amycolatopsis sp. NPDC089917 TaxID=3155187 RepID=UPI00342C60E4